MRVSSYRLRKQSQQLLWAILRTLLILGIAFVILHPLIEKLSMSFKAEIDMYDPTVDLIPKHFTLNNYVEDRRHGVWLHAALHPAAVLGDGAADPPCPPRWRAMVLPNFRSS